jgi:hypothetical protein
MKSAGRPVSVHPPTIAGWCSLQQPRNDLLHSRPGTEFVKIVLVQGHHCADKNQAQSVGTALPNQSLGHTLRLAVSQHRRRIVQETLRDAEGGRGGGLLLFPYVTVPGHANSRVRQRRVDRLCCAPIVSAGGFPRARKMLGHALTSDAVKLLPGAYTAEGSRNADRAPSIGRIGLWFRW